MRTLKSFLWTVILGVSLSCSCSCWAKTFHKKHQAFRTPASVSKHHQQDFLAEHSSSNFQKLVSGTRAQLQPGRDPILGSSPEGDVTNAIGTKSMEADLTPARRSAIPWAAQGASFSLK